MNRVGSLLGGKEHFLVTCYSTGSRLCRWCSICQLIKGCKCYLCKNTVSRVFPSLYSHTARAKNGPPRKGSEVIKVWEVLAHSILPHLWGHSAYQYIKGLSSHTPHPHTLGKNLTLFTCIWIFKIFSVHLEELFSCRTHFEKKCLKYSFSIPRS